MSSIVVVNHVSAAAPPALRNLPQFPPAAARLMSLLSDADTPLRDVVRVLSTDAALSAEVLRLANSPLGGRYGAATILHAVSLLGATRISGLVLTLSVSKFLRHAGRSEVVRRCWRHNLACAVAARHLAHSFDVDGDHVFSAGMMHDVGRLALLAHAPADYERLLQETADSRLAECQLFGIDHCEAGAWIAGAWRLPEPIAEVALHHHDLTGEQMPLTGVIHVACSIATQLGYGVNDRADNRITGLAISDELGFSIASTVNAIECEYGVT